MSDNPMSEEFAANLLRLAIVKGRAAELLMNLFDGGCVTFDPVAKDLVMIPGDTMREWIDRQNDREEEA
jgi:hypothetical protein